MKLISLIIKETINLLLLLLMFSVFIVACMCLHYKCTRIWLKEIGIYFSEELYRFVKIDMLTHEK